MPHRILIAFLLLLATSLRAQDGIFADFTITSATPGISGTFTCKLHYDKAPRAVANFIGLATGSRTWLDVPTGGVKKKPYYDGLTFHRVVSGFVIQGGSPNGNGTDGPGYTFKDEFDPTLRHTTAGILSMANSGLQSNGSQFFITLAPTTHLDDVHTIFGQVTSGLSVVQAIGGVATNASGKPNTAVFMQTVAIRRVGAAALAFDEHAQGLATVSDAQPIIRREGASLLLRFPRILNSEYLVNHGSTLSTLNSFRLGIYTSTPPPEDTDVTATSGGAPNYFFRVPRAAYPETLYTPFNLANSTLTLFTTAGTLQYTINGTGGGTYTYSGGGGSSGTITGYSWGQEAYRGRFGVAHSGLVTVFADLAFTSPTGGNLKGNGGTLNFTGTFTFTRP